MSKVAHINEIGILIQDLQQMYKEGLLDGLIIIAHHEDDAYSVAISESVGFIRGLGLLEAAKETVYEIADGNSED